MKKTLSIMLAVVLSAGALAGCTAKEEKIISPLPETLDVAALDNCTVAVSLEKGDVYADEEGKTVMKVKAYSYELYDMVDIQALEENSVIVRQKEEVKVTELEKLDSGLVRINGGEENGGFDLISNDNTVYYEAGMNDAKAYYELGEAELAVSDEFEYKDSSDLDAGEKKYSAEDLMTNTEIEYGFVPYNTSIVIENGAIIKMNKTYMP